MPVTLNLKRGIDLPVFQWLRFLPYISAAGASMCTDMRGTHRFIYMILGAGSLITFWRYDTWTDSYQQLLSPPTITMFAAGISLVFDPSRGTEGYVWLTGGLTASPWHMFAYYDVATNTWTSRAGVTGLGATFGTDADLCHTCSTYNVAGNDDYIYLIGNYSTTWYRYSITGNAWTAFTGAQLLPATAGPGCSLIWAFGYNTDRLYYIRGTGTAALYQFTISTSAWSADIAYGYKFETFTTGTVVAYDSLNRNYIVKDATHRIYYYQLNEDKLYPAGMFPYVSGAGIVGDGFVYIKTPDGAEYLYYRRHTGTEFWRMLIGWF